MTAAVVVTKEAEVVVTCANVEAVAVVSATDPERLRTVRCI